MKSIHDFKRVDQYKEYLRTYFAVMAMQGILSNPANSNMDLMGVNTAVAYADELLKQLEDGNNKS